MIGDGRKEREHQRIGPWASATPDEKEEEDKRLSAGTGVDSDVKLQDVPLTATEVQLQEEQASASASSSMEVDMQVIEDLTIEDVLGEPPDMRRRFRTPERPQLVKRRGADDDDEAGRMRWRINIPPEAAMDDEQVAQDQGGMDADSPLRQWYMDGDRDRENADMSGLTEVDRKHLALLILSVDITEVFSPSRVNQLASKFGLTSRTSESAFIVLNKKMFGLVPGASLDLRTGWNFDLETHRRKAWKLLHASKPNVVIGSPPCTFFSNLQELNKHIHRDDPAWMANFEAGKKAATKHIEFCILIYRHQINHGRHFLHEHPWGANSWKLPRVESLLQDKRVGVVEGHMCRFDMTSHVDAKEGSRGLVKKPTGFMSSSKYILDKLDRRCTGDHDHVHLMGGRAVAAQEYPPALCEAIIQGIVEQKRHDRQNHVSTPILTAYELKSFVHSLGGGHVCSVKEIAKKISAGVRWPDHWLDPVHEEDGGCDRFGLKPQVGIELLRSELDALVFRDGIFFVKDDVTGAELVPELVRKARAEEVTYVKKMQVYEVVLESDQVRTGGKIIGTRWVDVNKGDSVNPNCRSRLVGRKFNVGRDVSLYAAIPPLEALRIALSNAATQRREGKSGRRAVMINDVRRAYFYAKATRDLYIQVLPEDPECKPEVFGKMRLCLYGTSDAAKGWRETLSAHLEAIGFVRGVGHPSVFYHRERDIMTFVHGDDYVSSGMQGDLDWLEAELEKSYEIQTQKLGLGTGFDKEGKVLNRRVRCTSSGWELEADPRHAELVVEQLGVGKLRSLITPCVDGPEEIDEEDRVEITGPDATRFRGVATRCNYLAFDRPELQFATKEVCREMSKPTTGSLRRLRRIGQYLNGKPRLIWRYDSQHECETFDVYSDSDWAGCRKSRKPTSGGSIMRGSHCLKTWSRTQAIIAKSSAAAELYGVVRGAIEALGMATLCNDMGQDFRRAQSGRPRYKTFVEG